MVRGRTNLSVYVRRLTVTSPAAEAVLPARSVAVTATVYVPVFFGAVQFRVFVPRPRTPGAMVVTAAVPRVTLTVIREILSSLKRSWPVFFAVSVRGSTETTGATVRYCVKCCAALQYWIV